MIINRHRGEVGLEVGGEVRAVRYGWGGVALLQSQLGDDWDQKIAEAAVTTKVEVIAQALAIGLQDAWPEVTPAKLIALSPPLGPAVQAINQALQLTFHGPRGVAQENPPKLLARLRAGLSRALTSPGS